MNKPLSEKESFVGLMIAIGAIVVVDEQGQIMQPSEAYDAWIEYCRMMKETQGERFSLN